MNRCHFTFPGKTKSVSPHNNFLKATLPVKWIVCFVPSLFCTQECQIQFTLISEYLPVHYYCQYLTQKAENLFLTWGINTLDANCKYFWLNKCYICWNKLILPCTKGILLHGCCAAWMTTLMLCIHGQGTREAMEGYFQAIEQRQKFVR